MIHLYETTRVPNKIVEIRAKDLLGEHVSVHYNLNKCRPGKPPKEGETCFVVKDKPSGKVKGYVKSIALEDVETVVRAGTLARIRKRETREVCCFIRGTVVRESAVRGELLEGAFNPFRDACFYVRESGMCVDTARFAVFEGRDYWFVDPEVSERDLAESRVPNPQLARRLTVR